jgi:AraC family transcriptional regulator
MSFAMNSHSARGPEVPRAQRDVTPALSDVLRRLVKEATHALDRDRDAARACLRRAETLLQVPAVHTEGAAPFGGLAPWQVGKAVAHVERQLEHDIPIADLAAICRLSPSYFARAFKTSFGLPPRRYVQSRRIARAQHQMLSSEESLTQIALACGFADQAHFCRVFRRLVGQSPGQWRRACSGEPLPDGDSTAAIGSR